MLGSRLLVFAAAISGFLCVAIGAMGSHSLPKRLEAQGFSPVQITKKLEQCEIGTKYHMFHALATFAVGSASASRSRRSWKFAGTLFLVGTFLFSGGLYCMVFFDRIGHWSIVPSGGLLWMISWLVLATSSIFPDKSVATTGISDT
jgi:uncharacterized membrane protein YgdD (TMEM256/DUF423 family)